MHGIYNRILAKQTMYYLYLDESGDPGSLEKNGERNLRSSTHFTVAGIIVDESSRIKFEQEYKEIIKLLDANLSQNFKLHYNPLRFCQEDYAGLSRAKKMLIEDKVLSCIRNFDCHTISITVDKKEHFKKYSSASISPMNYALIYALRKFEEFLSKHGAKGAIYYEKFTSDQKKSLILQSKSFLPRYNEMPLNPDILNKVQTGDPSKEHMLEFVDFFAYIVFNRKTSDARWKTFKHKYFGDGVDSSNVEV